MRKLTLLDWKSSKGYYPEMAMQVCAYGRAYNIKAKASGDPIVERLGVLRLDKKTGLPEYHDCTDGEQARWEGFCGLLAYYHAMVTPTITERSRDRFYKEGTLSGPSVTTVLGCLNKPALVQWSANCSVEFIKDHMDEILGGGASEERIDQILKKAKTAHRTVSKGALDVGSIVHDAIETYLKGGDPEPIIGDVAQAQTAFEAFVEWKITTKFEPVGLECRVFHPTLLYGGTFDFVGYLDLADPVVDNPKQKEESK